MKIDLSTGTILSILVGLGKPSYLEKEPEKYLDPERWI